MSFLQNLQKIFKKKKILVTHDSTFHADDIFATAVFLIAFHGNVKVIRTRDESIINSADFVYDVGGVYDPSKGRFDHHQTSGAGERDNGVPYASFGLVWKTYGEDVCGSKEVADRIERRLVEPVDANDNGVNIFENKYDTAPYTIQDFFYAYRPSFTEEQDFDFIFMKMVYLAKDLLNREIIRTRDALEAESLIDKAYNEATDKRIIYLDGNYPWSEAILKYSEPLYVIYLKSDRWRVEAVRKDSHAFDTRKPFPSSWAGLRDLDLAKVTGVDDALFCHRGLFLAVAKSKEGAIILAQKALLA